MPEENQTPETDLVELEQYDGISPQERSGLGTWRLLKANEQGRAETGYLCELNQGVRWTGNYGADRAQLPAGHFLLFERGTVQPLPKHFADAILAGVEAEEIDEEDLPGEDAWG